MSPTGDGPSKMAGMTAQPKSPSFLAVDFYCGAGGTTRGLIDAGGYVIAGIDNDPSCGETYTTNNPNPTLDRIPPAYLDKDMLPATLDYPAGRQDEILEDLRELIPRYRAMAPDAPLLFSICAPCQPFTRLGQRRLTDETAEGRTRDKDLVAQTVRFIEEFDPDMVLSENVASAKAHDTIWQRFKTELDRLGYRTGEDVVCASRFGVPQYRSRYILAAVRGSGWSLSIPKEDPDARQQVVRDAIGHLPPLNPGEVCASIPNHKCRNVSELNRLRLQSVRPGETNRALADTPYGDLSLACHRRLKGARRGFWDVYTRLHPDRPSSTITTKFTKITSGRFGHYDATQTRGLSLHEGALLQSFPEEYRFFGQGFEVVSAMIGNAVPPKLATYMARWLHGLWEDSRSA